MMSSNTTTSKNNLNKNNNLHKKAPNPLANIIKNILKTNQKTVQMVAANTAQAILPFKDLVPPEWVDLPVSLQTH